MLILNNSPLLPNFNAPKIELDTKIADIYEKSQIFLGKYPEIWESIKNDLDDFNKIYIDSTHVEANTAFPADIDILLKIINRTVRSIELLDDIFGLPVFINCWTFTRLKKMLKLR